MGDGILACDHGTILEAGGYVVAEIAVYCWYYVHVARNSRYCSKEVNCRFKAACEVSGAGEEEVPYGC